MYDDVKKDNIKKNKNLKKKISLNYLYIIFTIIILNFLLPYLGNIMLGDNTGIDGIGEAIVIAFALKGLGYIILFILMVIKPIKILINYKSEFKNIFPKIKRVMYIILTFIPILFWILLLFEVPISNFIYKLKYETGENAYVVSPKNYKLPMDFYVELRDRGLLYNRDTYELKNRLNGNHDCVNYIHKDGKMFSQKCYEKATMVGITTESYYDSINNDVITNMHESLFPVYMYNAILTLPAENEKMQYAALGRFSYNSNDYGDYEAKFNDYYIECKILYVDEDIYAIIGLGESHNVAKFNDEVDDGVLFKYNYPFNMILTEKNSITTFYKGKYYPDGAIENSGDNYEMRPNTESRNVSLYPVRKVDRLDIDTINAIARELQDGVLKKSIYKHFHT